jgi:transposase
MYSSKQLDHLGLVSGMIDELQLVELINLQLEQDGKARIVSPGILCKSLILNGLGFTERTLYMVSSFFEDKPIELLLGEGIEASQLNDTNLGRCLDTIHAYGTTKLYANLVPQICKSLGLNPQYGHMDSTDFHVDGVYNSRAALPVGEEDCHVIRLTQGYSRDHRPDLNQVVLNMIVENQAGIPIHMQGFDGNISDKEAFHKTISEHVGQLQTATCISHLIMDSAGYTENSLTACKDMILWISRVPETLRECKEAIAATYKTWLPLAEGYQYVPLHSHQYGIEQRWLLVFSQAAYEREMITLKKNFAKKSEAEYKAFLKLTKESFESESAAKKAFEKFISKCKYLSINRLECKKIPVYDKKGRPSKTNLPVAFQYYIQGTAYTERATFEKMAHTKGKFIVATNDLDTTTLADVGLFFAYKGQSKVERGFRFLKDPQFMAATIFVKKPERVEALLFIMTLCLTVYAALEYRIRQQLEQKKETFANQLGKQVKNPTTRWVFQCFSNITWLFNDATKKPIILNIKPNNLFIIKLLGEKYYKYYFST